MKGSSKRTCGNSMSPFGGGGGVQKKDLGAASSTLLTGVKLQLQRRLFKPSGEISSLT